MDVAINFGFSQRVVMDDRTHSTNDPSPAKPGRVVDVVQVDVEVVIGKDAPGLAKPVADKSIDNISAWKAKVKVEVDVGDGGGINIAGMSNPMINMLILMIEMAAKMKIIDAKLGGQFAQLEFRATEKSADAKRAEGLSNMAMSFVQGGVGMVVGIRGGMLKAEGLNKEKDLLLGKNGADKLPEGHEQFEKIQIDLLKSKGDVHVNLAGSAGTLASAPFQYISASFNAESMLFGADAEMWGKTTQDAADAKKSMSDFIQELFGAVGKLIDGIDSASSTVAQKIC